ncbi:MAG: hypothetical protein JNL54_00090 [Kineosporiaceae bacterium]|nr:hypothetical protein [Kineosporiaceae bacterium]
MTLPSTQSTPPVRPRRPAGRLPVILIAVAAVMAAVLAAGGIYWWTALRVPPVEDLPDAAPTGTTGWQSGVWTGGEWGAQRVADFAAWRGSPADTAVTYPAYDTWNDLQFNSDWHVQVFNGFPGTLVYGLPLLPKEVTSGGGLERVAAGEHDAAFIAVADTLARHGRENSYIRIGLEANGDWFPWGAGREYNSPEAFKAAFRHVAGLLKARLPEARIVFDISAGSPIHNQQDRLDPLTELYPGDDVVDVVGVDHYDHYQLIAPTRDRFQRALRPARAAGLQDALDFARAHGKKVAVPEWGLTARDREGGGDNDFFIYQMYAWFSANAADLAFENYFNEPQEYLQSSIWQNVQNPAAAQEYRTLWSRRPAPSGEASGGGSAVSPSPSAGG